MCDVLYIWKKDLLTIDKSLKDYSKYSLFLSINGNESFLLVKSY